MKHIFLNLKRFDITPELGGVNRLAEPGQWGQAVASSIKDVADAYADVAEFAAFLPRRTSSVPPMRRAGSHLGIGSEGVHGADTAPAATLARSRRFAPPIR